VTRAAPILRAEKQTSPPLLLEPGPAFLIASLALRFYPWVEGRYSSVRVPAQIDAPQTGTEVARFVSTLTALKIVLLS
jgi:hypothetical protein